MKKKLNNLGITSIEILVCFTIAAVIVIAMFKTVNNYKDKQDVESYKSTIKTFKNTITREIQNDIIKNGGVDSVVEIKDNFVSDGIMSVRFKLKYGSIRVLSLKRGSNSTYTIVYEKGTGDIEEFELPKINNLEFNGGLIREDDGFLIVKIGLIHTDLGDKYDVLDLVLPLSDLYPYSW